MWLIISLIFMFAATFSRDTNFWIAMGLMVIAHNIEYLSIQIKNLSSHDKQ